MNRFSPDAASPPASAPSPGAFSPDYATARRRFVEAARASGATLDRIALDATGPGELPLSIDVAWLGSPEPDRVLLHSSGLHGVEGFGGSAIQLALLEDPPPVPEGAAIVLAHALNPFGMAWIRRFNEHNVDLNRNFLAPGEAYEGCPEGYRLLEALLNPRSPPSRDRVLFLVRAALAILRHGFPALKQAVVGGQYEFPEGLFFGGARLEQGPELWLAWLRAHLGGVQRVFAIDVHSGLGRRGEDTLLVDVESRDDPLHQRMKAAFGERVAPWDAKESVAYTIRGGLPAAIPRVLPGARVDFVTQEFGTLPPLRTLYALRQENRQYHHARPDPDSPAAAALYQAFAPADPAWRSAVLSRGIELAGRALELLGSGQDGGQATA